MNTTERLRTDVSRIPVPPPDLSRVVADGRRRRRRRRVTTVVGTAAAVGAVAVGTTLVTTSGDRGHGTDDGREAGFASVGPLDLGDGLRAYAAPGAEIHLGGRTFPIEDMGYLDTDATATSEGVVFFDDGYRPRLLSESGDVVPLGETPARRLVPRGWHPTAKADSTQPHVALTQPVEGGIEVQVVDLVARTVLARHRVPCTARECTAVRVEAMDGGTVFVRTPDGTRMWDGKDRWLLVATGKSRIADARNGVVLYDESAPAPDLPRGWRAVPGAIDSQLTFDGSHVLGWSSTLAPTQPGGSPIVLEKGPATEKDGYAWWTIDTDGSVLVAVPGQGQESTVHDCVVPSGECTRLGPLVTMHGDPMFIGNDM